MADIYEQHAAAFSRVSAFVILDSEGERVATVALKFPADGAARLWAYVHLIGVPMVRGFAGGFGYDKRAAAVAAAIDKIPVPDADGRDDAGRQRLFALRGMLRLAAWGMDSREWTRELERQGFRVLQAV